MKKTANLAAMTKASSSCFTSGIYNSLPGFKGFTARLNNDELNAMLEDEDVDYIEPDQTMYAVGSFRRSDNATAAAAGSCSATQTGSQSWGLSRTTRTAGNGDYEHDPSWGAGVKVYVIDTGSSCPHSDFNAKCSCGPSFSRGAADGCADGNGHGTHCASTVAGIQYGVSKSAEIIGVKVLGDRGSGSNSDVIAGMDWVAQQGAGSVASMSLGGGFSAASNAAADAMYEAGVTLVVAAGNDNGDACSSSPASAAMAYTVGATDINDARSSFSNYGTCVDIFAPGSAITAAWPKGGEGATNTISGTSMACPHVAGAAAAIISQNPSYTNAQVKAALSDLALTDVISDVKTGSPNLLLHLEC